MLGSDPARLLIPLGLIIGGAVVGAALLPVLQWVVARVRALVTTRRADRQALRDAASAEIRARALMSELCPFGWHARITVFGGAPVLDSPEGPPRGRIALDWTELSAEAGRPAVMRRVWSDTIAGALDAMVADRQTDETLEQIEQGAAADGILWPDLPQS